MSKATFICSQCLKKEIVTFNVGHSPTKPICEKCKIEMTRTFSGDTISPTKTDMVELGQKMLFNRGL